MSTTTTRLALTKPDSSETVDVTILNGDFDKIDNSVGFTPCTSSTRPSTPFNGQAIYESNTQRTYVWDNTAGVWQATSSGAGSAGVVVLASTDPVPTGLADGTLIVRKRAPVATETWTGANGASWPVAWTTSASGGTIDIQSNSGHILTAASAYSTARTSRTGVATGDLLYQLTTASTAEQYHFAYFRDDGAGNYYRCTITPTNIGFQKAVSGTVSYITSTVSVTVTAATAYWVRVDWVGSALSARMWAVGTAEPAAWTVTATDTSYTAAGVFGLGVSSGSAATAISAVYDSLTLQDLTP